MPKITYLKEFEGALWARLELDLLAKDMPVHILTRDEIEAIKIAERKAVWAEIKLSTHSIHDNEDDD